MITKQIEKDLNDFQKEKFLFRVCMQALQPDPLHLTVSQWADENRVLSTKSSSFRLYFKSSTKSLSSFIIS